MDGPRTDVTDLTGYTYYQANHSTCAASPATCPYRKGDLWKVTDALGQVTEFLRYDGNGRPLSIADPNGVVTDLEYHRRGWLTAVKVRGPNNSVETYDRITRTTYWPNGQVKRVTQPDGAYLVFTYEVAQRLVRVTDNDGGYIAYTLDAAGRRVAEETRDAANTLRHSLSRVYDLLGRLETTADASSNPTDYARDGNGNPTTITDALGRITSHQYDPLNRLARTVQDVGAIAAQTVATYDPLDRIVQLTDPKGLQTHYTYNALGGLLQLDSPDTGIATYGYDSGGNRTGQTSSYGYDALNRLTSVSFTGAPALSMTYQYDTVASACVSGETFALGRLTSIADASGSTSYCYDRFGQVARKVQVTNGLTFVVRYTYTPSGDLLTLTYPDETVVDYGRDVQERIAQIGVTGPGESREVPLTGATYAPFGAPTGWSYGNARYLARSLDLDYRATSILDIASGGLDAGFAYDAIGNLQKLHDGALALPPRATLDYDNLNRLTAFRDGPTGTPIDAYSYDATGNRTSFANAAGTQAYLHAPGSHHLASIDAIARGSDAAGNTTSIGGTAKTFTYDATNRLSEVKASSVTLRQYAYNGNGERVRSYLGSSSSSSSSSTYSIYDEAGHWLGDYDGSGSPIQQAVWMDDLPVGLLVGASPAAGRLHYLQPDHLGTPRIVIEPARDIAVWTWGLKGEAFGDSTPNEDPDGDSVTFTFDMRFPGQRHDAASGLNYNYFRDYDATSGRYVQSDPIGLAGGASIYAYVGGAPLSYVDPHGLLRFHPWVKRQYPNTVNYINATRDRMTATKYEGFSRAADTGRKHLDELLDPCAGPVVTPDRLKHDHGRYTNGSGELFVHRSYFDRFEAGDRSPELLDILNRTIEHELVHFSEYFWNRNRSTIEEGWRYENIVYGTPIPRN